MTERTEVIISLAAALDAAKRTGGGAQEVGIRVMVVVVLVVVVRIGEGEWLAVSYGGVGGHK